MPDCFDATVLENKQVAAEKIWRMKLWCPKIAREALPGQFITIKCEGSTFLRRPFSVGLVKKKRRLLLFSWGEPCSFFIHYKVVGPGTTWMSQRQKGEEMDVFGPLGGRGFIVYPHHQAILVAGGIGLAGLLRLGQAILAETKTRPILIFGVKDSRAFFALPLRSRRLNLQICTEDGSLGTKAKATECLEAALEEYRKQGTPVMVYAVGPRAMLRETAKITRERETPCQVLMKRWLAAALAFAWAVPCPPPEMIGSSIRLYVRMGQCSGGTK